MDRRLVPLGSHRENVGSWEIQEREPSTRSSNSRSATVNRSCCRACSPKSRYEIFEIYAGILRIVTNAPAHGAVASSNPLIVEQYPEIPEPSLESSKIWPNQHFRILNDLGRCASRPHLPAFVDQLRTKSGSDALISEIASVTPQAIGRSKPKWQHAKESFETQPRHLPRQAPRKVA
jgi:hypothetical protein